MPYFCRLSLALSLVALACGQPESEPSRRPDGADAVAPTPAEHTPPQPDAGTAAATTCGDSRNGEAAHRIPAGLSDSVRKLVATRSRLLVLERYDVHSASKTGNDQYSYTNGFSEVADIAVYGERVFVLSKDTVAAGRVSGGELEAVMYNASGGRFLDIDANYIYVATAVGDDSVVWRGPHHFETDVYGPKVPESWLQGPAIWGMAGSATRVFLLGRGHEADGWKSELFAVERSDGSAVSWGSIPGKVPSAFHADDEAAFAIAHDDDANEEELLAWQPSGAKRVMAHGAGVSGLAVDTEYVYFSDGGIVKRMRRDGTGALTTLFDGSCAVDAITVDADHVYFATSRDDAHAVYSVPLP